MKFEQFLPALNRIRNCNARSWFPGSYYAIDREAADCPWMVSEQLLSL